MQGFPLVSIHPARATKSLILKLTKIVLVTCRTGRRDARPHRVVAGVVAVVSLAGVGDDDPGAAERRQVVHRRDGDGARWVLWGGNCMVSLDFVGVENALWGDGGDLLCSALGTRVFDRWCRTARHCRFYCEVSGQMSEW